MSTSDDVIAFLKANGPSCTYTLREALNRDENTIDSCVRRLGDIGTVEVEYKPNIAGPRQASRSLIA